MDAENLVEWEREFWAIHRWGRLKAWLTQYPEGWDEQRIYSDFRRLQELWNDTKPLGNQSKIILNAILALEICNWNLENSILTLCKAIGVKKEPQMNIGHEASITENRWKKIWTYYLTLKEWLPRARETSAFDILLNFCDPKGVLQKHILGLLGESSKLKQLYVTLLCLNFEYWLSRFSKDSPQWKAFSVAVQRVEEEIQELTSDREILAWLTIEGKGVWIEFCHHKLFRRLDIVISSINAGRWRGGITYRGTDGLDRATTLEKYLFPIEQWIKKSTNQEQALDKVLFRKIQRLLGKPDKEKLFLAALLVSLLKSQQISARERVKERFQ